MGGFIVYSSLISALILFFPIFLYTDGYLDIRENKCWFSISLYKRLKIFGGYAQLYRDGVAVHLSKTKAVFVSYDKMTDTRKKFEITKGFQLWRYHQIVETGGAYRTYGIMIGALLSSTFGATFSILKSKHPFLSLKSGVLLTDETNAKLSVQVGAVFNMLVVIIAINKKILEAFLKWIRRKKLTAFWKKRQNSSRLS